MLTDATVMITRTTNWSEVFASIGFTIVFLLCIVASVGFAYIWITVAEIKDTVDDIYEIVDDDDDEKTTKNKEKSNDE